MEITVDNRVRILASDLPLNVADELRALFENANPQIAVMEAIGIPTYGQERVICSWRMDRKAKTITFPRGGMGKVREVLRQHDLTFKVRDARHAGDPCPNFPEYAGHPMRWYQLDPDEDGGGVHQARYHRRCVGEWRQKDLPRDDDFGEEHQGDVGPSLPHRDGLEAAREDRRWGARMGRCGGDWRGDGS